MKLFPSAILALATTTLAEHHIRPITEYIKASPAFRLVIRSANKTLDGVALGGCHRGAAVEGLCTTKQTYRDAATDYTTFHFNTTSRSEPTAPETDGAIARDLRYSDGGLIAPLAMLFSENRDSDLDTPIMQTSPYFYTLVRFDAAASLYRQEQGQKLKNWYVCDALYNSSYTTLEWKTWAGEEPQESLNCQKVEVVRVWVAAGVAEFSDAGEL